MYVERYLKAAARRCSDAQLNIELISNMAKVFHKISGKPGSGCERQASPILFEFLKTIPRKQNLRRAHLVG